MISRYVRRPVSHSLEIHGLSKNGLQQHPLPEKPDEAVPAAVIDENEESTSICSSEFAVLGHSNSITDSAGNIKNSWSTVQSSTGTGTSTEQSSVLSWGYDEFDKAATQQVQHMFGEIDELLYGDKRSTEQPNLQDECKQWASCFPHLRILGKQIVMPISEGYAWFPSPAREISNSSFSSPSQGFSELCIFGKKAMLSSSSFYKGSTSPRPIYAEERKDEDDSGVLVSEGVVEEYLAFDCRNLDDILYEKKNRVQTHRLKSGFPPVSPSYCMEDTVLSEVFDDVWKEMVGCMHELLWHLWGRFISDNQRNPVSLASLKANNGSSFLPSEVPQVAAHRMPHAKVSSFPSSLIQSQITLAQTENSSPQQNLTGLMVIQGIPLQQRNMPFREPLRKSEDVMRLGSSVGQLNRSRANRPQEHSTSSLSHSAHSARRRNLPRILYPLHHTNSRSGTPGSMDEIIRGTRLTTASGHLSSPPTSLSRNTLLPPIGSGDSEHPSTTSASRQKQKLLVNLGRVQSVLSEDANRQPVRERLLEVHSRPNTTYTFQSDTPLRRSLTVLDYANQYRTGRGTTGSDAAAIGVTGISLGITSSSYVDSFNHHALRNSPVENEEGEEDLHPFGHQLLVLVRSANQGGVIPKSKHGL